MRYLLYLAFCVSLWGQMNMSVVTRNGSLPTPTSSVSGGAGLPQTVSSCSGCLTFADATPWASIYYNTTGSPTCASTLYSGALTAATTTTYYWVACAPGYNPSAVASGTLTISAAGITQGTFSTHANTSSGTSIVITAPSGIVNGDLLCAGVVNSGTTTMTPPSGWSSDLGGTIVHIFWKIASSESGNYTFTAADSRFLTGSVFILKGTNATPVDLVGTGNSGTGTTATAYSITTTADGDAVIFLQRSDGTGSIGIPTGFSDCGNYAAGATEGYACGFSVQATAGASGDKTAATASPWNAYLWGIKKQ